MNEVVFISGITAISSAIAASALARRLEQAAVVLACLGMATALIALTAVVLDAVSLYQLYAAGHRTAGVHRIDGAIAQNLVFGFVFSLSAVLAGSVLLKARRKQ
jgi:hypothetical protein